MSLTDGFVDVGAGVVLRPSLTEAQFLSDASSLAPKPYIHNGPHRSYRLPSADVGGRTFVPVVFFSNGAITMVTLSWVDPSRDPKSDAWANWSEQRERAVATEDAAWLAKALSGSGSTAGAYAYRWGAISSGFDPKGGFSSVRVRYDSPRSAP